MAMNTSRQLGVNAGNGAKSMEKLSSGSRINRAGDDAAGLSISEKMRGQIRGLNQASRNSQDGISLIQTAEGALNESHAILQRMRELVVQAGNGTNADVDLKAIQDEIDTLSDEITGISDRTEFNGKTLLNGTYASGATAEITLQIGANTNQTLGVAIEDMGADAIGAASAAAVASTASTGSTASGNFVAGTPAIAAVAALTISEIDVEAFATTATSFDNQLNAIDAAIGQVSTQRSKLGAAQNRLEHTIKNLDTSSENLQASESRIRDVDMAKEMMEFSKNNILQQAATAMLAQANQAPQGVLQLLR
jgi:flagellin